MTAPTSNEHTDNEHTDNEHTDNEHTKGHTDSDSLLPGEKTAEKVTLPNSARTEAPSSFGNRLTIVNPVSTWEVTPTLYCGMPGTMAYSTYIQWIHVEPSGLRSSITVTVAACGGTFAGLLEETRSKAERVQALGATFHTTTGWKLGYLALGGVRTVVGTEESFAEMLVDLAKSIPTCPSVLMAPLADGRVFSVED
jgi:hypothetical protein